MCQFVLIVSPGVLGQRTCSPDADIVGAEFGINHKSSIKNKASITDSLKDFVIHRPVGKAKKCLKRDAYYLLADYINQNPEFILNVILKNKNVKYSVILATLAQQREPSDPAFTATKVKTETVERRITKLLCFWLIDSLKTPTSATSNSLRVVHIFCVSPSMEHRPEPFVKFFFQMLKPT